VVALVGNLSILTQPTYIDKLADCRRIGRSQRYPCGVELSRRAFFTVAGMIAFTSAAQARSRPHHQDASAMYGLIGKMTAVSGQRDALAAVLLEGTGHMPGCLSYVVAMDPADADALWITEVWDSQASHQASLALPGVKAAIAKGRPLIAGFSNRVETTPLGGHGLARP
jgi:quinol monooxygenase YgiN